MNTVVTAHIVKVFVNEKGKYGNPHSIIFDESKNFDNKTRQTIAKKIGLSETVFINDKVSGNVSIFNPLEECPFAGSALLATAWLLNKVNKIPLNSLVSKSEKIMTWQENETAYIRIKKFVLPPWNLIQLENPIAVEKIKIADTTKLNHTMFWSWLNKGKGIVRARTFAPDWGIFEDEANGSGSMKLVIKLGQKLEVHHGKGSVIFANLAVNDCVDAGGRAIEVESQEVLV